MKRKLISKISVLVFGLCSLFLFMPEVEAQDYDIKEIVLESGYVTTGSFEILPGDRLIIGTDNSYYYWFALTITDSNNTEYEKYSSFEDNLPVTYTIKSYEELMGEPLPNGKKVKIEANFYYGSAPEIEMTIKYELLEDVKKEVVYHNTFGAENNNPFTYYEGEATILLNDIQREGYRFLGWYTSPTFEEGTRVTMIESDAPEVLELYARWEEIEEENSFMNPETRTMLYVGIGIAIVVVLGTILVVFYRKKKKD